MMNSDLVSNLRQQFESRFRSKPFIVRSPGRVNIIGEHTDYNEGFVLPAAIDKAIYVGISKRQDDKIILYSEEFNQEHESTVSTVAPSDKRWPNYILGVVDQLNKRGYPVGGFELNMDGDVPVGAGLSSSAAVECATAFALNELFSLGIPKIELPEIGQKTEHDFAGVRVGIMDPFASVYGREGHVIKLDCRSLDYEYVPLQLQGYKIVLLNTNVEHSLASTEYNTRRKECEAGVAMIRAGGVEVNSLRDVTMEMLNQYVAANDALIFKRCKYVVEENERLLDACESLKRGDLHGLGRNMFRSHDGLSKEYEVSCPELDFLVQAVRNNPNVIGSRMMGGGFGGCTINLVKEAAIEALITDLSEKYEKALNKKLSPYIAQTADGSSVAEQSVNP